MRAESKWGIGRFRRAPLAAHALGMFALADPSATFAATTWTVNSCSNGNTGAGTTGMLRYALFYANDGDTVDMTGLACSTITLDEAGTVAGPLNANHTGTITVLGPGRDKLTITGDSLLRIFYQPTTPSVLILKDMTLSYGNADYDITTHGDGGCIYSRGAVKLDHVTTRACFSAGKGGGIAAFGATLDHSTLSNGHAKQTGGGISAYEVTLTNSFVTDNEAVGNGGGIRASIVSAYDSTVGYNYAGTGLSNAHGGGIYVRGYLTLYRSTIEHNSVFGSQGGIDAYSGSPASLYATIVDSTISTNHASFATGGMYVNFGLVKIYNSTIAFNTAGLDSANYAAGVATTDFYGSVEFRLHSALISNNRGGSTDRDFSLLDGPTYTYSFVGFDNLVRAPSAGDQSVFTITGTCPLLGPLRDNGGPTRTHALLSHSPAIDAGDNVTAYPYDQRGPPFTRPVNGIADIGAYEVQAEIVFGAGFDGC